MKVKLGKTCATLAEIELHTRLPEERRVDLQTQLSCDCNNFQHISKIIVILGNMIWGSILSHKIIAVEIATIFRGCEKFLSGARGEAGCRQQDGQGGGKEAGGGRVRRRGGRGWQAGERI